MTQQNDDTEDRDGQWTRKRDITFSLLVDSLQAILSNKLIFGYHSTILLEDSSRNILSGFEAGEVYFHEEVRTKS